MRGTLEETGIRCEIAGLAGDLQRPPPRHPLHQQRRGRQEFSIVLTARAVSGEPTPGDESREVRWIARDRVAGLRMDRSMRVRIEHYLTGTGLPYIG
ncbi:MAG TPA: NUDIX domain-containing protein [Nonomuraea sp.]|nr:NUDIX domain-containing protein [Nonomuraea sp.]